MPCNESSLSRITFFHAALLTYELRVEDIYSLFKNCRGSLSQRHLDSPGSVSPCNKASFHTWLRGQLMSGACSRLTAQRRRSCVHPRSGAHACSACTDLLQSKGCTSRRHQKGSGGTAQLLKPPLCWSMEGNWRKNSPRCSENMQTPWKRPPPLPRSHVLLSSHIHSCHRPPPAHVFTSCPSHYFSPSSFISPHGPEQRPHCVGWRGQSGRGARLGGGGGERAEGRLSRGATATSWEPVAALGTLFFIGTAWLFLNDESETT